MSDEFHINDNKTLDDYLKTVEGSRYFHGLYLKAVNHPVRKEILIKINKLGTISKNSLFNYLVEMKLIDNMENFIYNIDFLIKALCIKEIRKKEQLFYEITQAGRVVEYL